MDKLADFSKRLVFWFCVIFAPQGIAVAEVKIDASGWSAEASIDCTPLLTNMIQLFANPSPFAERVVRVVGVLSVDFEDDRLYLNKEFYDSHMPQYAIDIRMPSEAYENSKRFQGKYVQVNAVFKLEPRAYNVGVLEVQSLMLAESSRKRGKK